MPPFLLPRGGCLSNPFTPPRYIEGRLVLCRRDQMFRASTLGVQGLYLTVVVTARNTKHYTVGTEQAVVSVGTTADGRKPGRDTLGHILCVSSARKKEGLWRQPLSTTSNHIVVTPSSFGMKKTGRVFASLVMIKRHGTKITILLIGSD